MTLPPRSGAALALLSLIAACSTPPPPPPPPTIALTLMAGANQNPDPSGGATPVAVHLYQLSADSKFRQADVFALLEREKATLGADCPASDVVILAPGETKSLTIDAQPGVKLLGAVGVFRDIDHAVWRAVQPIGAHGVTKLTLGTDRLNLTLTPVSPP